ncbi:uncharacterized protein STEHIDRAFT_99214 [Stereum hirsutum FP-91666 SS1]|uniref:uncharacterized protein n=1 Tax=Stereum hirsutum (strain FP-91666) TaxID=721885 RepID=UPI0004449B86|nr:uncharacterized protein STEHIDRAFT_99214 [Stereum hirsutum FP-91666 SS1]EIM85606.1 hypothetical protein STEHIDRAFT_99214 [Stereum hirsutum FP-91666 SS1]
MVLSLSGVPCVLRPLWLVGALCAPFLPSVRAQSTGVSVSIPSSPATSNVVHPNFLGISLELSAINLYFGNDTSSTPAPVQNYFTTLRNFTSGDYPLRLRIGGNSMDSATYNASQSPILISTDPNANPNDEIVDFGPVFFDVIDKIGQEFNAQYLLGLSLRDPTNTNNAIVAAASQQKLGDRLDAFLLGNEPDLYTAHGDRPNIQNYTVSDYVQEFGTASSLLTNTSAGNILSLANIAGPTICCNWDLATTLQQDWLSTYASELKYITVQHYTQNNCDGSGKGRYTLAYYLQHSSTVELGQWEIDGIQYALTNPNPKPVIMDEFNSASCGGLPGISETFGVALWTVDYSLQLASVGYTAAYLHTREPGVTYNIFQPTTSSEWGTGAPFYAYLPVADALSVASGSAVVVDLNIANSTTDPKATAAGYAIYDANATNISSVVLFNFANSSGATENFTLPSSIVSQSGGSTKVTVRYLVAPSVNEDTYIAYGGQTYAGVTDGTAVSATWNVGGLDASSFADTEVDCASGCDIAVPGPGLAVIYSAAVVRSSPSSSGNSSTTGSDTDSSSAGGRTGSDSIMGGMVLASVFLSVVCMWS